jgi:CHAT domain-containing protein
MKEGKMKRILYVLMVTIMLASILSCETTYITIKHPDVIYEGGRTKFKVYPNDTLEILESNTCLSGTGICWKVKDIKTGEVGYVLAERMKKLHEVFTKEPQKTMSLEEAKKVSVEMSGTPAFVPPPRKINDILSSLQTKGQFDEQIANKFHEESKKQPPITNDDAILAKFYYERGRATNEIGQIYTALSDLRKAFYHAEKAGTVSDELLSRLGQSEWKCGSIVRAIELLKRSANYGWSNTVLSLAYLSVGDIESAIKAKDRTVSQSQSLFQRHPDISLEGSRLWRFWPAAAEAFILNAQGKYKEEEKYLRICIAERPYIINRNPIAIFFIQNKLAYNLSMQGRLTEAEVEARRVIQESIGLAGGKGDVTAEAVGALADIMIKQNRYEEAETLARYRIKILESIGLNVDTRYNSIAHFSLGNILVSQYKYDDAIREYDFVSDSLKDNKAMYDNNYSRDPNLILTLIKTGRTNDAMKLIGPALEAAVKYFGEKSLNEAELLGLRGMARLAEKKYEDALSDFNQAFSVLIDQKDLGFRSRIILEAYLELLSQIQGTLLEQKTGDSAAEISFHIAGMLGSRSVDSALNESNARAAAAYDTDLADLARKEQDIRKQITALEMTISNVMSIPTEQQSSEGVSQIKENIATLTRAGVALQKEINQRFPKYADFIKPKSVSAQELQSVLRSDEALLSIYTADDKTFVWAVPKQGKILFHAAPLGRKEMEKIVTNLREPLDANPNTIGDIPDFDTSLAYHLYAELLKPVAKGWESASDLIIINSGPLGQIPLSLLPTEPLNPEAEKDMLFSRYRSVPWLIRKVSVTSVPTVSSLISLRTIPVGDPKRKAFIGFGDPIFNKTQLEQISSQAESDVVSQNKDKLPETLIAGRGLKLDVRGIRISEKGNLDKQEITSCRLSHLQRLPDTAEEIKSIAWILNADMKQDVFLNKDATEYRIKTTDLTNRKIIAFATHALVRGDLDGLEQPALAMSSPEVTGENEDGLLTIGEILKLKLNADCVVLSACNTAASQGAGQEALSGFGRAFFYAGTRSLLVSLWPVETTSAKKLVTGIFEAKKTDDFLSRSQALRKSMLHLINNEHLVDPQTGKRVASYAHPLFWAPFNIVGETGKQ